MFYNVLKAKDIIELDNDDKIKKATILQNETSALVFVGIKKHEIIDTHTSDSDTAVMVIDGEIELHFNAEKFKLDKGELLMFKKEKEHKLTVSQYA